VLADDLIICQGPYVIVRTTVHSTDRMGFFGHPGTGKVYAVSGIDIYRFENGKVVERWGNLDLAGLLKQIGYTFAPPSPLVTVPAEH
jgi:predicted ester cyclase